MKKNFYLILLACSCFSVLFQSCNIGEIAETDENAQKELVFDYSESALYEMLYTLDLAIRVDAYVEASSVSAKEAIQDTYFPSSTITQDGDNWILENSDGEWTFESNDSSLTEVGAKWAVSLTKNSGEDKYISSGDYVITTTADKQWSLQLKDVKSQITNRLISSGDYENYFTFESYGNYSISASYPDSIQPFYYNYAIESGSGGFDPDKVEDGHYNITVDYSIKSKLKLEYNTEKYIFSEGCIAFNVNCLTDSTTDSFDANIYTVPNDWNVEFE